MDTKLYTMTYSLNSGIKGTVNLSPKQIEEWINCYIEKSSYVTIIGKEYFGINSVLVADFKVHNAYSEQRIEIEVVKQLSMLNDELVEAYDQKKLE
ncbi:hypothetical protein [Paenibacillus sp. FSL E2-0178]|uniref:hypothetical protein n=1 Tax=Paenibacillus sp. FSL E2-0178 TaxID=2921361 RepID=UPI00315863D1